MLAGIRDILVVSTPHDITLFNDLLGDGSQWGLNIDFAAQQRPDGLAQAFIIGEDFLGGDPSALVLGDNVFYGHGLPDLLHSASTKANGATVFAYHVSDPARFGVVEFDEKTSAIYRRSRNHQNLTTQSLGCTSTTVLLRKSQTLAPSPRGELEITDINQIYLERGNCTLRLWGAGVPGSILVLTTVYWKQAVSLRHCRNARDCKWLARRKSRTLTAGFLTKICSDWQLRFLRVITVNICRVWLKGFKRHESK